MGAWRKTHECEGFSSDIWCLFDPPPPQEGQLSGPGGWRRARGRVLGTAAGQQGGVSWVGDNWVVPLSPSWAHSWCGSGGPNGQTWPCGMGVWERGR